MKNCPSCNTEFDGELLSCPQCGAALATAEPAPAAEAAEASAAIWQDESPSPAGKPKSPAKIIGICAAVLAVLAAGAFLITSMIFSRPNMRVKAAVGKTMAAAAVQMDELAAELGLDMLAGMETQPMELTAEIDLSTMLDAALGGSTESDGSLAALRIRRDPTDDRLYISVDLGFFEASLICEDDTVALSLPTLLERSLKAGISTFVEDWNASIFGEASPIDPDETGSLSDMLNPFSKEEQAVFDKMIRDTLDAARKAIVYAESDPSRPSGIGDEMDTVTATLGQEDFRLLLEGLLDASAYYAERLVESVYALSATNSVGLVGGASISGELDSAKLALQQAALSDILMTFYIDDSGFCRAAELSYAQTDDDMSSQLLLSLSVDDAAAPLSGSRAELSVRTDYNGDDWGISSSVERVSIVCGRTGSEYSAVLTAEQLYDDEPSDEQTLITLTWDPAGELDNYSLSVETINLDPDFAEWDSRVALTGTWRADGDTLLLTLAEIVETDYWGESRQPINLRLSFALLPEYDAPGIPADAMHITDLTEEDIAAIALVG